jgi:hypothetical protein
LLTDAEFNAMFSDSTRMFRAEVQPAYAIGHERADFESYLGGRPVPPTECEWLRPWLDRLAAWNREGKTLRRVRILAEPPTPYQRWLLWGDPWMASAGEINLYMSRSTAQRIGFPLTDDWWEFDDSRVIGMRFTAQGEPHDRSLITDPTTVAAYCAWRDIALQHATAARTIVALSPKEPHCTQKKAGLVLRND